MPRELAERVFLEHRRFSGHFNGCCCDMCTEGDDNRIFWITADQNTEDQTESAPHPRVTHLLN